VIRDGEQQMVDSEELVPGDLVVLEEGDAVPADLRLIEVAQLELVEGILTGESVPVQKSVDAIKAKVKPHSYSCLISLTTSLCSLVKTHSIGGLQRQCVHVDNRSTWPCQGYRCTNWHSNGGRMELVECGTKPSRLTLPWFRSFL
jgi:magnesium-transporting ATPase (P-type)